MPNRKLTCFAAGLLFTLGVSSGSAQIDPVSRNLIELGLDQPVQSQGPQGAYLYYYFNNPHLLDTNVALRLAIAPLYLDGELGFRGLISPTTDFGIGIYGGGFSDTYYEVRQGDYIHEESFDGHAGGASLSLYQLLDPGKLIPLNLIGRVGFRYLTYSPTRDTADNFTLPANRFNTFTRVGLRLAGNEPLLFPDLGFELSAWFERQWRSDNGSYGFNGDRQVNAATDLYWVTTGLNYAWTNVGYQISLGATAGGSSGADRFSAWRIGGVLPLVSEFPLILPGYFYQELTVRRFAHFHADFMFPIIPSHRLRFLLEGATAAIDALPGFEQPHTWQTGAGCGLIFSSKKDAFRVVVRYGYGFNAIRHGEEGAHSLGLLFQYKFGSRRL